MVSRSDDLRLRELLTERLGEEATDKLLERLPLTPVTEFATRHDIAELRGELLGEFGQLEGKFGQLEGKFGELRAEFSELRGEFGELRADLRTEMADRFRAQTWYLASLLVTALTLMVALVALRA